jgi:hypothetical protein
MRRYELEKSNGDDDVLASCCRRRLLRVSAAARRPVSKHVARTSDWSQERVGTSWTSAYEGAWWRPSAHMSRTTRGNMIGKRIRMI